MLAFLLLLCVLAALAWWLFPHLRGERGGDDAERGSTSSGGRVGDDRLHGWLLRVPKVFTQPHLLPTELASESSAVSDRANAEDDTDSGRSSGVRRSDEVERGSSPDGGAGSDDRFEEAASDLSRTRETGAVAGSDERASGTASPEASARDDGTDGTGRTGEPTAPSRPGDDASDDRTAPRARLQPLFDAPSRRDDLTRISGIGPVMQDLLNELGVVSFAQLAAFDSADIERVDGALEGFSGRIVRDDWVGQARGFVAAGDDDAPARAGTRQPLFEAPEQRDDLKRISGIGEVMEKLLNELGVVSFAQLAAFDQADIDKVDTALEEFPGRVERDDWVGQARQLVGSPGGPDGSREPNDPTSSPDRSPADGSASSGDGAREASAVSGRESAGGVYGGDDLTRISGIGRATRVHLAELGVTTFADVAGLEASDIQRVEQALDDAPGRIERDGWIAQAKALLDG